MIKVLYVDDEPLLLDICRQFVEVPGEIAVDTASSVLEAEGRLAPGDYDVVVSDYQMPGTDGIEFLRHLRAKYGHVPFILFTGRGREEVAIEALNSGADFYLQKGGDPTVQYGQLRRAILQLAKGHATERSLAVSQRKYADLVKDANASVLRLDPEMTITHVNPYGQRMLGWGNEIVGICFLDWLDRSKAAADGDPRHIFKEMFAERGAGETFTHSFRTRDGEERWVKWTCRIVRNEKGMVDEVLLFGEDATEAKRGEAKLQRSLSIIKAAFDSSDEGILITGKDRLVTECNHRFLEMWNVPEGVIEIGARGKLLSHVGEGLSTPREFYEFINDVFAHPLVEKRWTIAFTDGRKFEAFTKPLMLGTEAEGRFWSFRDVTQQTNREKEFQAREDMVIGLLDDNKANMMIIDPGTGEIVYANKAACEFYGHDRKELLKLRISDLNILTPEMVAQEMRSAQTERMKYFNFQHWLANGQVRDVEVFSGPIQFEGRQLLFSLVHDISEMERTKRQVEELELRHNRVLNSLAVGILATDRSGKMIYANRKVQEMLGRTEEDLLGQAPIDLFADDMKDLARKGFAARHKGESGTTDYRLLCGDGSELWVQLTGVPFFDKDGYGGTIASVVDISERRHDAELIRESERKFRDIFNNMRDAVMMHEPGKPFFEVNEIACSRFGYTREELLQMRPEDLDTPDTAVDVPDKTKQIMEYGSAIFESSHRTKDGRTLPAEINAISMDIEGSPTILVVCRDITERKMSEERLAKANEKLNILNNITRHDIMNQLMVLKGNLELARSQEKEPVLVERLGKIGTSADIINSQLLFAKDYQQMGTSTPQWQNIGHLIMHLPDVKAVEELELDRRLDQLDVYADPMLAKVFHNILEDSAKYAERPLRVKIGLRQMNKSMVISYEDHGPGIPAEEKEKIFEMGYGKGTGLGLHLSVAILSITDIKIRETGEPGKGVRFEIEVPEGRYRFDDGPSPIKTV